VRLVDISIAFSMLFATGQRDMWKACDRSAASRLSAGQSRSVYATRILLMTRTFSST
jgi:hypothetical protein